jgi:hypothetical protein
MELASLNFGSLKSLVLFILFVSLRHLILEHIDIDALASQKVHFKHRQVIIEISLNNLPSIVLKHFVSIRG